MKKALIFAVLILFALSSAIIATDDEEAMKKTMNIKAIDWNKLAGCLPDKVEGMKVSELDGGEMSIPDMTNPGTMFSYSFAERTYSTKDKTIILRITDTGFNQMLQMPFMMMMEMETPEVSFKNTEIAGNPAKRMINKEKGKVINTQYLVLISDRVLVMSETENTDADEVEALIKLINFKDLAVLAK
ncbi:MAG: hypothetical protein KAR42_10270 [candidate division Zixibacteria bacterium]|nr:hypothetical protein [candidate division Zixibacteria bacterium]